MINNLDYGIIYCFKNKINGMQYFGQTTSKNIEKYWKSKQHGNTYIHRAIRKHGWNNFKKEIICKCGDALSLGLMEDFCIQVFNTLAPNGYNLRRGGVHGKCPEHSKRMTGEGNPMHGVHRFGKNAPMWKKKHSPKTLQLQSDMKIGEKNPMFDRTGENNPLFGRKRPEHSKRMTGENNSMYGVRKFGKDNPNYGKKQSEKSKEKFKKTIKNLLEIFCQYCNKKYKYQKNLKKHEKDCEK